MMPVIGHVQTASVPKRNEPGRANSTTPKSSAISMRLDMMAMWDVKYRPASKTLDGLGWMTQA